jgi:hypothetical protein
MYDSILPVYISSLLLWVALSYLSANMSLKSGIYKICSVKEEVVLVKKSLGDVACSEARLYK